MSFNFNPMKYTKVTQRTGAAITDEVKAGLLEYVKIAAASSNSKLAEIDKKIQKIRKLPATDNTTREGKVEHNRRVREIRAIEEEKAPIKQALSELADRWKKHREEQWTGMNGYSQIERFAIEDVLYLGPYYAAPSSPQRVTVEKQGKPVKCFCAYTSDVILEESGVKYNLGGYKIVIPLYLVEENQLASNSRGIQFIPLRHLDPAWIAAHHPEDLQRRYPHHYWNHTEPRNCWSEFGTVVEMLMMNCDIVSLLSVCVKFQFNWNPGSPFGGCRPSELPHAEEMEKPRRARF